MPLGIEVSVCVCVCVCVCVSVCLCPFWAQDSTWYVVGTQQIILLTVINTEFRCRLRGNSHQSQYFKQIEVFISCIAKFLEIVCLMLS